MKATRQVTVTGVVLILLSYSLPAWSIAAAGAQGSDKEEATSAKGGGKMLEKIHWLGHDCFRIDAEKVVYFDPFELADGVPPADIVFITHGHSDHCSPKDVAKIQKKGTVIVAPADCAGKLSGEVETVKAGDKVTVQGVSVEVVPAYNVKVTRKLFHPQGKGGVGFIVTLGGERIYHAGDTDFIPEMKNFKVDIALIPVSGTYVMTAEEAAEAVQAMKPGITIPMHYGSIVGDDKDAAALKKLVAPLNVQILKREKK
jgi:L-ascorbate metabolism protein UlaG (beta-lactamase superfamily)